MAAGLSEKAIAQQASPLNDSSSTAAAWANFVGSEVCRRCHQEKFDSFSQTRHHLTSQLPDRNSIAGKFTVGENTMTTFNPEVSFRMDARDGKFYESAILGKAGHTKSRTQLIDLVIGSGRKGQTYLYWRGEQLFELPVSYWTELNAWVNSPGYVDGSADFDRAITPRCLECHATYFQVLGASRSERHFNKTNFVLGISCQRCHGPAADHVQQHATAGAAGAVATQRMAPVGAPRERKLDVCAQCHGGVGESLAPAFSFAPGEPLGRYIKLQTPDPYAHIDVHGNQVALLEKSKCFQSSPDMTCTTCHDVHAVERPVASYSDRCLACHKPETCPTSVRLRAGSHSNTPTNCIDCHMPVESSNALVLDVEEARVKARVRNHWIRAYPASSKAQQ